MGKNKGGVKHYTQNITGSVSVGLGKADVAPGTLAKGLF